MANVKAPHALTCSHSAILRGGKHVPLGDDDGRDAQHTDDNQVDEARLWVTVERVIQPRNKTPHDQKSNAGVIQSRKGTQIHSVLKMTAHHTFQFFPHNKS